MTLQLLYLSLIACLLTSAESKTTHFSNSIEQGFYNCGDLHIVPIAHDLMTSVWNEEVRKSFPQNYSAFIQPGSFTFQDMNYPGFEDLWTAEIRFSEPPLIAGVPAAGMKAIKCRQGCGWTTWLLEFSDLSSAQIKKLQAWADQAVSTDDGYGHDPIKTILLKQEEGIYNLVCDVST